MKIGCHRGRLGRRLDYVDSYIDYAVVVVDKCVDGVVGGDANGGDYWCRVDSELYGAHLLFLFEWRKKTDFYYLFGSLTMVTTTKQAKVWKRRIVVVVVWVVNRNDWRWRWPWRCSWLIVDLFIVTLYDISLLGSSSTSRLFLLL